MTDCGKIHWDAPVHRMDGIDFGQQLRSPISIKRIVWFRIPEIFLNVAHSVAHSEQAEIEMHIRFGAIKLKQYFYSEDTRRETMHRL